MPKKETYSRFIPAKMTPPEKDVPPESEPEEQSPFHMANAASAGDCTGLIPTPPENEEEMEAYMSICDYQPPNVMKRQEER